MEARIENWEGFGREELNFLRHEEYQAVVRAMKEIVGSSNSLYIGKRVAELRAILSPFGYFTKAVRAMQLLHRTAYGYMQAYHNATESLPEGAVDALLAQRKLAMTANRNGALGEWTAAIELVPPPATGSTTAYARWADQMITSKPKRVTGHLANRVPKSPNEALAECYRFIERIGKRLPRTAGARKNFGRDLIRYTKEHFEV